MNRLRNRLILIFLAATLAPWAATLWMTTSLLEQSLSYAPVKELDQVSKSLERTGREYYQRAREDLKQQALSGHLTPRVFSPGGRGSWPETVRNFWESGEAERFVISGESGERLEYFVRQGSGVRCYAGTLGIGMRELAREYRSARQVVESGRKRDLRRGFTYTYVLLSAGIWTGALVMLVFMAHRISRPIHRLTEGLSELAAGNLSARVEAGRDDEIGRAVEAFNGMAAQLRQSRERLVYLTQLASWQSLARKMAHEVKNSLTPIRLTVEEMLVRYSGPDRAFVEQAAQIVVDEVEGLERRIRAFSQFAAEPPVRPVPLDVNTVLEERVAFLRNGHPEVSYTVRPAPDLPRACADEDLLKSILVNLLENAAEAAGPGGRVLGVTAAMADNIAVEVHDSGSGLSEQARASLFQPTISFKKRGMGLGLSIARKGALLSGGDIVLIQGELGGAGFRVLLPKAS
ncbi:MAG: HAMP domain-containing protein [Bryobacterales bacterium]|nr:HAMP domain-containing protein [Bryobacterales bacterium]